MVFGSVVKDILMLELFSGAQVYNHSRAKYNNTHSAMNSSRFGIMTNVAFINCRCVTKAGFSSGWSSSAYEILRRSNTILNTIKPSVIFDLMSLYIRR